MLAQSACYCLRGTFIDEVPCQPLFLARARSAPFGKPAAAEDDIFEAERRYVSSLEKRVERFAQIHGGSPTSSEACWEVCGASRLTLAASAAQDEAVKPEAAECGPSFVSTCDSSNCGISDLELSPWSSGITVCESYEAAPRCIAEGGASTADVDASNSAVADLILRSKAAALTGFQQLSGSLQSLAQPQSPAPSLALSLAPSLPLWPAALVMPAELPLASSSSESPPPELQHGVASTDGRSRGSAGHPELCPRPCIFFAGGHCSSGAECGYCHLPHDLRPSHLDKRHRELFRSLEAWERQPLLLTLLRDRAEKQGFQAEAQELLALLNKRLAVVAGDAGLQKQDAQRCRRLVAALKKMTFTELMGLAVRGGRALPQQEEETGVGESSVRAALSTLRSRVASLELAA